MSKKGPYLFKDVIYSGPNSSSDKQILAIVKNTGNYQIVTKSYDEIEGYPATFVSDVPNDFKKISHFVQLRPMKDKIPSIKSVICSNLKILTKAIYPSVKIHLARMNATNGESLPNSEFMRTIEML
jgi:hypothetical protein